MNAAAQRTIFTRFSIRVERAISFQHSDAFTTHWWISDFCHEQYALAQTIYVLVSEANVSAGIMIVALFFFQGTIIFLGILGEYIGAIHSQVRTQNIVVEDELIGIDDQK